MYTDIYIYINIIITVHDMYVNYVLYACIFKTLYVIYINIYICIYIHICYIMHALYACMLET